MCIRDRPTSRSAGTVPPVHRRRPDWNRRTPYLLILAAILLELLIHIVPMLAGIWMSFIKLNQFFIANWSKAPGAGLGNYKIAVDFSTPIGRALLHSFTVTCLYTLIVVGLSWLFGMSAAAVLQLSLIHISEPTRLGMISYAVFCLKKKKKNTQKSTRGTVKSRNRKRSKEKLTIK